MTANADPAARPNSKYQIRILLIRQTVKGVSRFRTSCQFWIMAEKRLPPDVSASTSPPAEPDIETETGPLLAPFRTEIRLASQVRKNH